MTSPAFHPIDPEPLIEIEDDFTQAVVDVAHEVDARRTWRERVRDAVRKMELFLSIVKHHLRGRWR